MRQNAHYETFKNEETGAMTAFTIVKKGAANKGMLIATTGGSAPGLIGIVQEAIAAGKYGRVCVSGRSKLLASTTIALGAKITATTAGAGVTTTADHDEVIAMALYTAATAANDLIDVEVRWAQVSA